MSSSIPLKSPIETAVMRKVTWRLVPFLMLAYFIAFVDRVNSGFAALQMNQDIGLTKAAFGLGAGLFYIAYVICEVPSNLAMEKVGRAALDRPHHDHLGHGLGAHGPRGRAVLLLCSSVFCSVRRRPGSFPA